MDNALAAPAESTLGYDPAGNPFAQLRDARSKASLADKRILVVAGDENPKTAFFAMLPEAIGHPRSWVLGADGVVLQSQNTLPLEDGGKSYDVRRFLAFIAEWGITH